MGVVGHGRCPLAAADTVVPFRAPHVGLSDVGWPFPQADSAASLNGRGESIAEQPPRTNSPDQGLGHAQMNRMRRVERDGARG